jgi:nucleoporin POM34
VPFSAWAILLVRIVFAANIVIAFLPLVRRYYPDDIADIPLTPSQRASMGLKTDVHAPPTPGSAYASPSFVTPPRYQRSTPRSNSFSNQDLGSHSPLNGSPRPNLGRSTSNSPFNLSGSATKRLSYNSSMSSSLFGDSSSSATPGTPTPSTGKASVGLNNKWLYEKRRDSPKSNLFI